MEKHDDQVICFFDGACEPRNPGGTAAYGIIIKNQGTILHQEAKIVGKGNGMSNNVAEYSGCNAALKWLIDNGLMEKEVVVRGDSKLVVEQMSGNWRIKSGLYVDYALECQARVQLFKNIRFHWIPREHNADCDKLSKDVLIKHGVKITDRS